jgi:hypothetical protein
MIQSPTQLLWINILKLEGQYWQMLSVSVYMHKFVARNVMSDGTNSLTLEYDFRHSEGCEFNAASCWQW